MSDMTRSRAYRELPKGSARRVYIRIMEAAVRGRGVTLSPDEVFSCSLDDTIATAAWNALEGEVDQ